MKDQPPHPRSAKFRSMQEIADLFEMDPRTLSARIKQEGIELPSGRLITPKLQKAIFEVIGYPNEHIKEELRHV